MAVVMVMMKMVMMTCLHSSQSLGILPEVTQQGRGVVWD